MAMTLTTLLSETRLNIKRDTGGVSDARVTYFINWAQREIAKKYNFREMEAYLYNPVIEDCEDAWLAKTNVTCTADSTYYKTGSYSAKMAIAAAFTTGLAATEVITETNLSEYTHIKFWIRSSVATSAGDLQFCTDDTAACASPIESLNITALTADTWSEQTLKMASPSSNTAIISVGLNVVTDNGAQDVYIDDVRVVRETSIDVKRYAVPTRCKDILGINLQDGAESRKLTQVYPRDFDRLIARSEETTSNTPSNYIPYGAYYELFPIPDSAYAQHIRYSIYPTDLSGTNTSDLDNKDDLIIMGATFRLFRNLRQHDDAQAWKRDFYELLGEAILEEKERSKDWSPVARGFGDSGSPINSEYWRNPMAGQW